MNPFDPAYKGQIAEEAVTPSGRAKATVSQRMTEARQKLMESPDPLKRIIGNGTMYGMGRNADPAKAGRILKASKL